MHNTEVVLEVKAQTTYYH